MEEKKEGLIQQIIDRLQGQCMITLADACEEVGLKEDDLTSSDHDMIDNQIFNCEKCGWWCEIGEANINPEGGGDICNDCKEEDENQGEDFDDEEEDEEDED